LARHFLRAEVLRDEGPTGKVFAEKFKKGSVVEKGVTH
jgi:hypothetical protein